MNDYTLDCYKEQLQFMRAEEDKLEDKLYELRIAIERKKEQIKKRKKELEYSEAMEEFTKFVEGEDFFKKLEK